METDWDFPSAFLGFKLTAVRSLNYYFPCSLSVLCKWAFRKKYYSLPEQNKVALDLGKEENKDGLKIYTNKPEIQVWLVISINWQKIEGFKTFVCSGGVSADGRTKLHVCSVRSLATWAGPTDWMENWSGRHRSSFLALEEWRQSCCRVKFYTDWVEKTVKSPCRAQPWVFHSIPCVSNQRFSKT